MEIYNTVSAFVNQGPTVFKSWGSSLFLFSSKHCHKEVLMQGSALLSQAL